MKNILIFLALCVFFYNSTSFAGEADVIEVDVNKNSENSYNFSVTVFHKDTGWEHYANKWEIIGEDGTIFGTRILHHPHVSEQPFTRSLSGVKIPDHVKIVTIRAHDSVHKYGGKVITVKTTIDE
ncbi:MAG: hypothetical protein ABFR82_13300 [Nitrospirota bacterium]